MLYTYRLPLYVQSTVARKSSALAPTPLVRRRSVGKAPRAHGRNFPFGHSVFGRAPRPDFSPNFQTLINHHDDRVSVSLLLLGTLSPWHGLRMEHDLGRGYGVQRCNYCFVEALLRGGRVRSQMPIIIYSPPRLVSSRLVLPATFQITFRDMSLGLYGKFEDSQEAGYPSRHISAASLLTAEASIIFSR